MAQILNSIKSSNKEYSEKKYKFEKEIRELQEEIKKENLKRKDGWLIEKKDYINAFYKKYFWIIELLISINVLILIGFIIYSFIHIPQTLIFNKIFLCTILLVIVSFFEYFIFYGCKIISSDNYIKHLNLISDNKIKDYKNQITDLKKHFKISFNSKQNIKKHQFLLNHEKIDFVDFVKKNFDNSVYLINDFCYVYNKELIQIDHILITTKGIFCIEIKSGHKVFHPSTNSKWVYYTEDTGHEIDNPQEIIIKKALALEDILGNLCLQIIPTVIFTHPDGGFIGESTACKILNMDELPYYYKEKKTMFTEEQTLAISKMIMQNNKK